MENFKETRICHLSCRISHFVVVLIVKSRGVVGFLFLLLHLFLQKKKKIGDFFKIQGHLFSVFIKKCAVCRFYFLYAYCLRTLPSVLVTMLFLKIFFLFIYFGCSRPGIISEPKSQLRHSQDATDPVMHFLFLFFPFYGHTCHTGS